MIRFGFIVLGLVLGLAGCSPQKQLAKLLAKYPELLQTETITVTDTVIVPEHHFDTAFVWNSIIDTFTITNEKVTFKIIRDSDTIRLEGGTRTDTIIVTKPVEIERIKYVTEKSKLNYNFLLVFGILFISLLIYGIIRNRGHTGKNSQE